MAGCIKCPRKRITHNSKDEAMMPLYGLIQDSVVTRQQFWHLFGMILREFCATFDVREEKSDGAGREGVLVFHLKHGL